MKRMMVVGVVAVLAAPAVAQAPGEVALQVSASGTVHRPADDVSETLSVFATGDTREAARAALDVRIGTVRSALAAMGIPAGAVTVSVDPIASPPVIIPSIPHPPIVVAPPVPPVAVAPAGPGASPAHRSFRASATVIVQFANPAWVARIGTLAEGEGVNVVGKPRYTLKDETSARAAAAADAIAAARGNAERYAAAMKMRIVRVTRVSDYGQNLDFAQFTDLAGMFDPTQRANAEVTVRVRIWMDFAMAPL